MGPIILRCEVSANIGLGHFSRLLSIYQALQSLKQADQKVFFLINPDDYAEKILQEKNIAYVLRSHESHDLCLQQAILQFTPSLIILDQKFEYSIENLKAWRQTTKIVVLDFLGKITEHVDLTIIPNCHLDVSRSRGRIFNGLDYVILGSKVLDLTPKTSYASQMKNIAITTGGSDPEGLMIKLYGWTRSMVDFNFVLLPGDNFKHRQLLPTKQETPKHIRIIDKFNFKDLMQCDMVISAFGVTIYELLYLQMPTLMVSHSIENAEGSAALAEKIPSLGDLGYIHDLKEEKFKVLFRQFIAEAPIRQNKKILSGNGHFNVAKAILSLFL